MFYTQAQLLNYLLTHNVSYQLYTHDPVFTCEQASSLAYLDMPGVGIKNLFLKDDQKNLFLVCAVFDTRIDLKSFGQNLGLRNVRFADETLLMKYLGVEPGSVTPLALINDTTQAVQVILDTAILQHRFIQIHPLKNDATVVLSPADLVRFLGFTNRPYLTYDFTMN